MNVLLISPPYLSDLNTGRCGLFPTQSDVNQSLVRSLFFLGHKVFQPAWEVIQGYLSIREPHDHNAQYDLLVIEFNDFPTFYSDLTHDLILRHYLISPKIIVIIPDFHMFTGASFIKNLVEVIDKYVDCYIPIYYEAKMILKLRDFPTTLSSKLLPAVSLPFIFQSNLPAKTYDFCYIGSHKHDRVEFASNLLSACPSLKPLISTGGRSRDSQNLFSTDKSFLMALELSRLSVNSGSCTIPTVSFNGGSKSIQLPDILPGRIGMSIASQCVPIWITSRRDLPFPISDLGPYLIYRTYIDDVSSFIERTFIQPKLLDLKFKILQKEHSLFFSPSAFWDPIITRLVFK